MWKASLTSELAKGTPGLQTIQIQICCMFQAYHNDEPTDQFPNRGPAEVSSYIEKAPKLKAPSLGKANVFTKKQKKKKKKKQFQ